MTGRSWTDERTEVLISRLLRAGVLISALTILAAGIWFLSLFGGSTPDYTSFRGESATLSSVAGILKGIGELDCRAFIQFGVLLLIATPVARVALAAIGFWAEGDRTYVVISLIVLAILLFSLSGLGVP